MPPLQAADAWTPSAIWILRPVCTVGLDQSGIVQSILDRWLNDCWAIYSKEGAYQHGEVAHDNINDRENNNHQKTVKSWEVATRSPSQDVKYGSLVIN